DQECPAVLGGTVTLDEGENVTCTITNDDQAATLIIIKHVVNDNGGTAKAENFTLDSGGTDDTPDDFPGAESPGTTVTLDAGAYNVTETGPSGYSASFSADCSGTIANGQTKTCTVTNNDIQPQLIVIKHVINDNGGAATASQFTMEVSGNNVSPVNFAGSELGTNVALDAGSYSVAESSVPGYSPTFSAGCTGSIAVGETKTCTITNDDISPTLTVTKVLLPADDTGLFNLQIDGVTQAANIGDNGTTGAVDVDAGAVHTVGETAGTGTSLSDYVTTIGGDCAPDGTITLALAENKTCTITNVRRGSIVIFKNALGGDGTFDFTSSTLGNFSLTTAGGTASTTFSGLDPANTYDVAETVPAGWELNSATCDSGETIDSIDLDPGETVTCTFENEKFGSIVIVKNTVGGDGTFDFTSSTLGNFSLTTASNTASATFSNLDVDLTYDVAETVPTGWDLTSATCNSGETIESIDLDPGETVTCTFTNTKRGVIVITKEAIPDDAQDFQFTATENTDTTIPDFTLDDDADNTLPKTMTFSDLKPGNYTVTETLVAGWDLNGMSCSSTVNFNSNVGVNLNAATATVDLGPGDTVVCTFANTKRGHIIVDKVTDPAADTQSFSFDANGGFSPVYADFSLTDASAPNDQELRPGNYSVAETLPSGWDLESATCTSSIGDNEAPNAIELDPGETVNCTFTNEKDAFIIVEKQTDPDNDPTLFDFTTNYSLAFQLSDGQTNNSGDLDPGTYSVTETVPAGWDLESVACTSSKGDTETAANISLQAGETVTCVFTNEKDAFIIIEKQTNPDGDPQAFSFTPSYGAAFQLSDGQTNNSGDLDPGTYSVSETVPSGWDLATPLCSDGSSASSISLQAGETVTCVFTNTKRGHIIVDKVTLPSGDTQSFAFTTTGSGYTGFNLTDAAAPNDQELVPGTYSVTETVPAGWDLTGLSCSDPSGAPVIAGNKATINLAAGETVNCTFTNTKRGKITIVKAAVPNDAQDFAFTSTISTAANFLLDDDSNATLQNSKTVANLVPGAYSVSEGAVAGWDLTGLTCNDTNGTTNLGTRTANIALDPGEEVTCTFTNTKRGTIIVEKQTNPNGAPGLFTFTGTAAGTIADNGTITVANLVPGTYTSTEADPVVSLFALTSITCNDGSSASPSTGNLATRTATFNLDPGETVKCVFTNTKDFHAGTIGFWKNWRNHYTSSQFQLLINYLKTNNPKIYNKDLINNTADDLTIAKHDTILNVGNKTTREQMILAQFTALKFNLAITQLQGTSGLVQKNDNLCTAGVVDISSISGATAFFGTSTPTVGQIVNAVENRWTGKLTTNRSDWKWNLTTAQKDMLIKVITGINEGTLVMSSGCP
ncbi:MAG TPA: hypothetical protein VK897_12695, partial [Anaerolineales bacterium]|nr:hypothetical protein [Anaerolineales bacterium]